MDLGWISFTTDYGTTDGFVAACHGTIARIAPAARVIDVTHEVPAGDVRRGAHVLAQTVTDLPHGVHLAVVDPGVGTARRPIAVTTAAGAVLVGPDNGLLVPAALALGGLTAAVHLTNPAWFAPVVSRTFHGRDIFAPVAARLASGADLTDAGKFLETDVVRLPAPHVAVTAHPPGLTAEVLTVDRFGNVQLAARPSDLPVARTFLVAGHRAVAGETFADAAPGALVVLTDSAGHVAVAANCGNAAALLAVKPGDHVALTVPPPEPPV